MKNNVSKYVGQQIRKHRQANKMTQRELGIKIGVKHNTISSYENGTNEAEQNTLFSIANTLNISIDDLFPSIECPDDTNIAETNELYHTKEVLELPIVGTIACGNGVLAYQDIQGYKKIPLDWVKGAEHFLLRATGDSMINARINDGDLLLIRQQEDFEQGAIMAIMINDEAVLKKIYRTDGSIMLQSENPNYPPKFLNSEQEIRIIGKLKMNLIEY